jgi:hypothetical protein
MDTATPEELSTIAEIRQRLTEDGTLDTYKATDTTLLRFYRGRKGDIEKAVKGLHKFVEWRIQNDVDSITEESIQKEIDSKKLVVGGVDVNGRPIVTLYARRHQKNDRDIDQLRKYFIYSLERLIKRAKPEEEKMTILFDLQGFGLYCMDYEALKMLIDILNYNYPETLGVAIILNAPFVFTACWAVIKPWLDPVTAAKCEFSKIKDINRFISAENVPADVHPGASKRESSGSFSSRSGSVSKASSGSTSTDSEEPLSPDAGTTSPTSPAATEKPSS